MLLARAGHRVLLLDRAAFGSDTLSTHLIHQPGVAALDRWGLLDQVRASGAPAIDQVTYAVDDIRLVGCSRGVDGRRAAYAPRRQVLDALLTEGAITAGVHYRERCAVTGLLRDALGRVVGVEGTHRGRRFTERASLVIGADGMRSSVARLAGAKMITEHPRLTCAYYGYWQGLPARMHLWERPGSWVATVPTNGDATLVAAYFPQSDFDKVRTDAEAAFRARVRESAPAVHERIQGRSPLERLRGTGQQQNFVRRASGPGWALVGDAGHHKDSITARGISDAFAQVENLVSRVSGQLDDPALLDQGLHAYATRRDTALAESYDATLSTARLEVHPRRLALLRAVQEDRELTTTYFDVVAGIRPGVALLSPRLLARV